MRRAAALLPPALLGPLSGPVVLFFHGVEECIHDAEVQSNHHALDEFAKTAIALKEHFEVAPLSELPNALERPRAHRRTVFLTSDDGYANTLRVAAPVLKELGLPWALFVSTHHIDTGALNPMFVARAFLRQAGEGTYSLPHFDRPVRLNGARDSAAADLIQSLRFLPGEKAAEAIASMAGILDEQGKTIGPKTHPSEEFLNWDEVRNLSDSGVIVGGHADWHWALHPGESAERVRHQADHARRRIEAEVGPCRYFAYPFGNTRDIGRTAWRAVRDAGYEYAFTTLGGVLSPAQNRWLLPRYGLSRREAHLPTLLPLLRLGNPRVARWQASLA